MKLFPLFLFLFIFSFCQGQNSSVSEPIHIKIRESRSPVLAATAVSNQIHLQIGKPISSSVSAPVHLVVGKSVSKPSGVSGSIHLSVGKAQAGAPAIINRSETSSVASREENTIVYIPKFYALIIAVDNYGKSSGLISLNKPIQDASKLYLTLTESYHFAKENTLLLKDPTRNDVLRALEDMSKKITDKDNLLIFYAGHGIWDERLKLGYWLPSDGVATDKVNWIANSTLRDYIAGIQAKHMLLITDACFSGSIFKTRDAGNNINSWGMAKIYQLPSRKAMTSGTLTTVPDESKFMEYLLKRLRENKAKYLTSHQLFFSLETAVLNNTSTVPQYGTIQDTGDEGGDFVFIR